MNSNKDIDIIVPVFNEYENLFEFLNILEEKNINLIKYFTFVDNGSSDIRILPLLSERKTNFLNLKNNIGFGGGIKHGIKNSNSEYICWMPCNLKIHPLDAISMIEEINNFNPSTLYKSTRIKVSQIDSLKTMVFSIIQSIILKKIVSDTGGTPTIITKNFFKNLDDFPDDYSFETYVYLKAKYNNLIITRPKITYGKRKYGNSHWQNGLISEFRFIKNIYHKSKNWKF